MRARLPAREPGSARSTGQRRSVLTARNDERVKAKILLFAIGAPLAGFGIWSGVMLLAMLGTAWEVRDWPPVEAQLSEGGYSRESRIRGADVYVPYATYHYEIDGRSYVGRRVGISGGADSFGDHQREVGQRLKRAFEQGEPITVHVNPEEPGDSVHAPVFRWRLAGVMLVIAVLFGGLGGSFLAGAWKAK